MCRKIVRDSRKSSWRLYASEINSNATTGEVFCKIEAIQGKHSSPAKILLVVNSGLECDSAVVPYCLVDHFASVISVHNFSPTFLNRQSKVVSAHFIE